jgi:hypothetical protein
MCRWWRFRCVLMNLDQMHHSQVEPASVADGQTNPGGGQPGGAGCLLALTGGALTVSPDHFFTAVP